LYLACSVLLIAEIFVPSGGLISFCALLCLGIGMAVFFRQGATAGWVGVGVAVVMIPSVLVIAYKVFPRTRFGRSVTLAPPEREPGDAVPDSARLREMLGAVGVVVTPLRPVGMCDFSGQRVECVAESGYVERGRKVKIIDVESTQLTVRIVEES
jgi:membrane-bound ClpP family serine protease